MFIVFNALYICMILFAILPSKVSTALRWGGKQYPFVYDKSLLNLLQFHENWLWLWQL